MSSIFWSLPGWLAQDRVQGEWWALDGITPPVDEPVTLADVKVQARVDGTNRDDVSIAGLLVAARRQVEKLTNRSLLPQTWALSLQRFPIDRIVLPRAPLIAVDFVQWTGIDEVTTPMDPSLYKVNTSGDPGSVVLRFGCIWPPNPLSPSKPVVVQFQAGYPYFSGLCDIDPTGLIVTTSADSPTMFDTTWTAFSTIVIGGFSCVIASVKSENQLTLMSPSYNARQTEVPWALNRVPQDLKTAIMMLASHWFGPGRAPVIVGRGVTSADISFTVRQLIAPYRISTVGVRQQGTDLGLTIWP
jgi:uncharacterized phiE125 gp8 family phage protein